MNGKVNDHVSFCFWVFGGVFYLEQRRQVVPGRHVDAGGQQQRQDVALEGERRPQRFQQRMVELAAVGLAQLPHHRHQFVQTGLRLASAVARQPVVAAPSRTKKK